ncbi:MAG: 16S rRNA (cytosine(967)-C(5))-methyltransferase RsmB [Acutalibacteraceae bacterium]
MKSARQTAYEILLKIEKEGAFSNLAVDNALASSSLGQKDRALVSALIYGTTERKLTLDYQLERYLSKPLGKLKRNVHILLRMGAYQILFLDRIPNSAAVNETVRSAHENNIGYAAGMINAVLRRIAENGLILPDGEKNGTEYLSIKYSCPPELISMWKKAYGEENTIGLLSSSLEKPPVTLRVNTLKTTAEKLISELECENTQAVCVPDNKNALVIQRLGGNIESLESYKKGLFHVQDLASQYCAEALGAKEGDRVIDMCSAPGGKCFTAAEMMNNNGDILACDIYPSRTKLIDDGADRLGITCVTTCVSDGGKYYPSVKKADRVLCDVPCSGLGVIRHKPEIKYKPLDDFKHLPEIQYGILSNAAAYVKKGGRLVYSTCTLNKKENDAVCDKFLLEHPEFECIQPLKIKTFGDRYYTLMPHINGCDGFFIAVFSKSEE